ARPLAVVVSGPVLPVGGGFQRPSLRVGTVGIAGAGQGVAVHAHRSAGRRPGQGGGALVEGGRRAHIVIGQHAHLQVLGGGDVPILGVGGIDRYLWYGEIFTQVLGTPPAGLVTHGEGEGSSGAHQLAADGGLGDLLAVDVHPGHVHLVLAAGAGSL